MSLNEEERGIMVRLEYERAKKLLEETERIASLGMWNTASGRLYYSLFHAVSALLINDGLPVNSHKGANLRFGQHYVQSGEFPPEAGRLFTQMQSLRERADYNVLFEANQQDFEDMHQPVKDLVELIGSKIGF